MNKNDLSQQPHLPVNIDQIMQMCHPSYLYILCMVLLVLIAYHTSGGVFMRIHQDDYIHDDFTKLSWWRHQMETFSALLTICAGNSPVTGEFLSQRPVTRIFGVFLWSAPEQRLEKTIEMPVIWDVIAHNDVIVMYCINRSLYSQNNPSFSSGQSSKIFLLQFDYHKKITLHHISISQLHVERVNSRTVEYGNTELETISDEGIRPMSFIDYSATISNEVHPVKFAQLNDTAFHVPSSL